MSKFLTILFLLFQLSTIAQNVNISGQLKERIDKFDRRGRIKENDYDLKDISGVSITLYTKSETIQTKKCNSDGSYTLDFTGVNEVFYIKFEKKGFLTKISELDLKGLTANDILPLTDWDYGLRKNSDNLASEILNKPFERYYYDQKNGELVYDDNYALDYQVAFADAIFTKIEENQEIRNDNAIASNEIEAAKKEAENILNIAENKAEMLLASINEERKRVIKIAESTAQKKSNQSLKKLEKDMERDLKLQMEDFRKNQTAKIYAQVKDSILLLANAETDLRSKNERINSNKNVTKEDLDKKKLTLYAQRQQLEIDRLKALTKEDSLVIQLREQQISSAEADIRSAESEIDATKAKLEAERKELLLKDAENKNQKNIIVIVSLLVAVLILISIVIFVSFAQKRKTAQLLQYQNDIIAEKNENIMASIKYAKRIQDAILPHEDLWTSSFKDSFVLYMPKDVVSGDFYWMHPISKKEVIFAAVDCTGHGVPGAFMSIVGYHSLHRSVNEFGLREPGRILDSMQRTVNMVLQQGFGDRAVKDGMDMALCYLNKETKTLQYSGAYNPLWILRDGEILETKATKQAVGMFTEVHVAFENHTIQLIDGDIIYVFSDGYADQFGGINGKKIMSRGLKEQILKNKDLPLDQQKEELKKHFITWINQGTEDQVDDVCILAVQI